MPLALAYSRYNLKPASPSNLAPMLLLVVTLTLGNMQISICINRGFQLISVSIYITISVVASQNNHKGQIYNGTASPTLVEKDCWSVYEYTPCQLMLLSFALGYVYRPVKTSRKENDLQKVT